MSRESEIDASMFRTDGKPAPGRLVIVQGFLNTWSGELGLEDFESTASTRSWLRKAGLWRRPAALEDTEVLRLKQFREALRRYVIDPDACAAAVQEFAESLSFRIDINRSGKTQFRTDNAGLDGVIGELMQVVHGSQVDGTWARFKCCQLETCGWSFYDHTKNRSGRWCSMKTCGSRHKARAYLKRQAQEK